MEIEIISSETITPSTPTPPHLRIYPLSFIDHIIFRNYVPSLFFYHPNEVGQKCDQTSKISDLKKSLSHVLSRYYPFAGRFRDQLSIECNDHGVSFLVTRIIGTKLSTILQNPTETLLNPLFPDGILWEVMSSSESIIIIQINCFPCGGMAISLCMCHKVGDATTLFNFVKDWATMNREKGKPLLLPFPSLDGGVSVFPQGNLPVFPEMVFTKHNGNTLVCKRFVFQASKIESLKEMVSSHAVQNPTRVEVVTAWIHKCAVSALGLTSKPTSIRTVVNLRKRMVPLLPDKCIGNMFWYLRVFIPAMVDKSEIELYELVSKIKKGLCDFCDVYPEKFGGNNKDLAFISECLKPASSVSEPSGYDKKNQTLFIFTSWCRFPMYEADFGWGKPIWVTTSLFPVRNGIFLMDTRYGDGIEAVVNMEEKDMSQFERSLELLQYASPNPNREGCNI